MMKPTGSRLLVRVVPEPAPLPTVSAPIGSTTANIPVVLPSVKGNTVITARVIDMGPDVGGIPKDATVIFSPYGFDEVTIGGEKLVIIHEDMILAYETTKQNTGAKR